MNETFKTNNQIIEIEATATEIINTKVVFWSHDKGTARLKFQLKKEGAVYPLTEGTIVPICLLFKSNSAADGVGRHIYNATIDDAVNGLISFILPDNILGYQGIVDGSIYIDMPNNQSLDTAGRFTFNIRRSPIDDMVPELEDYYYAGFNAVDQRIKDTLAKIEIIETDFIKEMNAMQSKLNKFESDSKVQMNNIQQQITDKELYTKKETDDLLTNTITEFQQIHKVYNFKNKTVGDVSTNVHRMDRYGTYIGLKAPTDGSWVEATQIMYDNIIEIDDKYANQSASAIVGAIPQFLIRWNLVGQIEKDYPNLFNRLGLITTAQKSGWIRGNSNKFAASVWGRGGGLPNGENEIKMTHWGNSGWDTNSLVNNTSEVKQLRKSLSEVPLRDDGYIYILCWGKASDGTTKPQVVIDTVQFEHSFKIDMSKFYVPQTQTATATQAGILKVIHGLTSTDQLSALSAAAGKALDNKISNIPIQKIAPKPATDLPSTYSVGISITDGTTNLGYPNNYCIVETIKYDTTRATQYCFPRQYLVATDKIYIRSFGSSSDSWGEWQTIIMGKDIVHNLTTTATDLPLSAGMGKQLKESMVNTVDNQTIGGIKNFTAMPKLNGVDLFEDTGWVNGTWGTDITSFNNDSSNLIRFRKIGNDVYFKGVATNTKVLPIGVQVLVKNIPAEFIPSDGLNVFFPVMQGSIKNTWHCALKATDKTLTLERYGTTSIIEVPANQWLPFSGSYPV